MRELNIDFLIKTPIEKLVEDIDLFFNELLQAIESYLQLEPIDRKIDISVKDEEKLQIDVFSVGVDRFYEKEVLYIRIYNNFYKFVPILLLREAYKCFIPFQTSQMKLVDIFINQKVVLDLRKSESIKEWDLFARNKLFDYNSKEYCRLDNFLKQDNSEKDGPFIYFFKYVRRNIQIISEKDHDFLNIFLTEYLLLSSKSLYHDEVIETIRILYIIFNEVQYYTALLDYQHCFKEFKEQGIIQTNLSLNKFTENLLWIKKFSNLSPSYRINWPSLSILSINCNITFNPILKRSDVRHILNELPFFILLKECRTSFAHEIEGYFVVPNNYLADVKKFLKKSENNGYMLQTKLTILEKVKSSINLNYFREYHNKKTIVNKEHKLYDKKYELSSSLDYGQEIYKSELTLLDWLFVDRLRYFSHAGFNFEKRAGALKLLKIDLMYEVSNQRKFITDLKTNLLTVHSSAELRTSFLEFLKTNQSFGFFYIKNMLAKYVVTLDLLKEILTQNPSINNAIEFLAFAKERGVSYSIESNITFNLSKIRETIYKKFLPLYFKSKELFEKETIKFTNFFKIFSSCYDLKIFNLRSIRKIAEDKSLLATIFKSKEEKLTSSYESYKLSDITNQAIEDKLDKFLNNVPPVIKPDLLINILTPMTQFFVLLLKNNEETVENFNNVSYIVKRMGTASGNLIYAGLFLPCLNGEEKNVLISTFKNIFKENLVSFKRYMYSGFQMAFSRKDFYDLEKKAFFYTNDLFDQFFLNMKKVFGDAQKPLLESSQTQQNLIWSNEKDISKLIKIVEDRISKERIDLSVTTLNDLVEFHNKLNDSLLNLNKYKEFEEKEFFKNCVKSIDFVPSFQDFGLSKYFLYFYPTDINKIDFKLLLNNSFQNISYPAQIDNSNSFLIDYIYPYRNPSVSSYLNWLTRSKKAVREYCLFFVKTFYQILQFDYNVNPEGWDLDPNRFKMYFQNVLFNPEYNVQIPRVKKFNIGNVNGSNYFGLHSSEFKALSKIYDQKSINIKSYFARRYFKNINNLIELLKKGLLLPFITVKNLDLVETVTIILPKVDRKMNNAIIKIFSFFNVGFIYEIEGEFYIHGFEDVVKFENGIMIKLYLPNCQIDEFEKLFDLLFEYMEIDHYLILNDLIDGKILKKNIFNELKFLETYNPLTNLIWNDKDKNWRNHKLFNENFEPVYPDMSFGKNNYDLDSVGIKLVRTEDSAHNGA